jgi:hypothetical protein
MAEHLAFRLRSTRIRLFPLASNQIRRSVVSGRTVFKNRPSRSIADIESIETVFKDWLGYDVAKMADSVRGMVGVR